MNKSVVADDSEIELLKVEYVRPGGVKGVKEGYKVYTVSFCFESKRSFASFHALDEVGAIAELYKYLAYCRGRATRFGGGYGQE